MENESNTPDYLLCKYLMGCLSLFASAAKSRDDWYDSQENDKREDSIYALGLKAGWNMGLKEDTEKFQAAMSGHGRS